MSRCRRPSASERAAPERLSATTPLHFSLGSRVRRTVWISIAVIIILPSYISLNIGPAKASNAEIHAPILIDGDSGFTVANGVTHGVGTASNPYVIEGWEIASAQTYAILIENTKAHFLIRDVYVHDGPSCNPVMRPCYPYYGAVNLMGVSNAILENMTISRANTAVIVEDSAGVTIASNLVRSNLFGIGVGGSANVAILNNDVSSNSLGGIGVRFTSNIPISGNIVVGNGFQFNSSVLGPGIGGFRCDCYITGNTISNNHLGVFLNGAPPSFHNNFINNTIQADSSCEHEACSRTWDDGYPSGGNYWSDFAGVDNCSGPGQDACPNPDGIADHAHIMACSSFCLPGMDRYPLMKPFAPAVSGRVRFKPASITSEVTGDYLVALVRLPKGYETSTLVLSSIRLNGTITPANPATASQCIRRGESVSPCSSNAALVVRLNMTQVEALMPKPGDFILTVSGNLLTSTNFRPFEASSAVHFTLSRNTRERQETTHDDKTNLTERDSRADTRTIDHASAIRGNLEHAKHRNESTLPASQSATSLSRKHSVLRPGSFRIVEGRNKVSAGFPRTL